MTEDAIEGDAFSAAAGVVDVGTALVLAGVALGETVAEVALVLVLAVAGAAAAGVDDDAVATGAAGGFLGYDKNS